MQEGDTKGQQGAQSGLDSAVVLAFSLVSALFICIIPLLTTLYRGSLSTAAVYGILFGILPIATYGITCIFNIFIQLIRCGSSSVNGIQIATAAAPSVGFVAVFGGLAAVAGFLRYPVESILPSSLAPEIKKGIAVSFFIFWGAVYGQALGGSLSQSCVKS